MSFFEIALQGLNDSEKERFNEWERAAIIEVSKDEFKEKFKDPKRTVVNNIRQEEHFYERHSDRSKGFIEFLRELGQSFSTFGSTGLTAEACYEAVCQRFCLLRRID